MRAFRRAQAFLATRLAGRAPLRLCLRMTVAAVLTFLASQILHLPWALWAVLTAVIVTHTSIGKSMIATIDYMIGTLGGAVYSCLIGLLVPHGSNFGIALALAVAVGPLSLLASADTRFAAAPFTAVMVLLLPPITHSSAFDSAFYRVVEVAVGCLISLTVSLLVLPQSAQRLVHEAVAKILARMSDLLPVLAASLRNLQPESPAPRLQALIGAAFRQLLATSVEAQRERDAYVFSNPDPQPLIDAALRLRQDLAMLERAAVVPLAATALARLDAPIAEFTAEAQDFLLDCAASLTTAAEPPSRKGLNAALARFSADFSAVRRDHLLQSLPTDAVERVFALGFCFEQMYNDLVALENVVRSLARLPPANEMNGSVANSDEIT